MNCIRAMMKEAYKRILRPERPNALAKGTGWRSCQRLAENGRSTSDWGPFRVAVDHCGLHKDVIGGRKKDDGETEVYW